MSGKNGKKILIACSDDKSRSIINIMLHKLGYQNVVEAGDVDEASKVVSGFTKSNAGMAGLLGKSAPSIVCELDLIVLTSELLPSHGLTYLESIRKIFPASELPVLFITNSDKDLDDASEAGANDTIVKPFSQNSLGVKVNGLVGGKKAPVIKSFGFSASDETTGFGKEKKKEKQKTEEPEPEAIKVDGTAKQASGGSAGRASFYRRGKAQTYSTDGGPTAELIDDKVDGHYHEKVDVIGGGQNCFWAAQNNSDEKVRLEYLSPKGKKTGVEAKKIPLEQFMHTFYLCDENNCEIIKKQKAIN